MEINIENVKAAYKVADDAGRKMLHALFPDLGKIIPAIESIKSERNAIAKLGKDNVFVKAYNVYKNSALAKSDPNFRAFLLLRIICAALNEGWVSTPYDVGYSPVFHFVLESEINDMERGKKSSINSDELFFLSRDFDTKNYWAVYCSRALCLSPSCLSLKTKELAEYCGKQFIDIWMDYLLPIKKDD